MFKQTKNTEPKITCEPARKNGGYLSIRYFVVITLVTVRISAQNSSELPKIGLGASSFTSDPTDKIIEPIIPKKTPTYAIFGMCSLRIILAKIIIKIGSNELTTPACPDEVNRRACVSNKK